MFQKITGLAVLVSLVAGGYSVVALNSGLSKEALSIIESNQEVNEMIASYSYKTQDEKSFYQDTLPNLETDIISDSSLEEAFAEEMKTNDSSSIIKLLPGYKEFVNALKETDASMPKQDHFLESISFYSSSKQACDLLEEYPDGLVNQQDIPQNMILYPENTVHVIEYCGEYSVDVVDNFENVIDQVNAK